MRARQEPQLIDPADTGHAAVEPAALRSGRGWLHSLLWPLTGPSIIRRCSPCSGGLLPPCTSAGARSSPATPARWRCCAETMTSPSEIDAPGWSVGVARSCWGWTVDLTTSASRAPCVGSRAPTTCPASATWWPRPPVPGEISRPAGEIERGECLARVFPTPLVAATSVCPGPTRPRSCAGCGRSSTPCSSTTAPGPVTPPPSPPPQHRYLQGLIAERRAASAADEPAPDDVLTRLVALRQEQAARNINGIVDHEAVARSARHSVSSSCKHPYAGTL